jgi:hypothetical protein
MPCCGRPNNRPQKDNGAKDYYARYAYLNHHQKAQQLAAVGTKCPACDALTVGDPCSVCNNPKPPKEETS